MIFLFSKIGSVGKEHGPTGVTVDLIDKGTILISDDAFLFGIFVLMYQKLIIKIFENWFSHSRNFINLKN